MNLTSPECSNATLLNPRFEENTEVYENVYTIDVPTEVTNLCAVLGNSGGKALLVGGYPRDKVMEAELDGYFAESKDCDIEVYGIDQDELLKILEAQYPGKLSLEGRAFTIIKVKVDGLEKPLDVSIPRRESNKGAGHKDFEIIGNPSMTISEAAKRRDLTINTLAYDPLTKKLYDSYNGIQHIRQGLLQATDEQAFIEDPVRVLRAMQFAARFEFSISPKTLLLCRQMVEQGTLDTEPRERITEEFVKLLTRGKKPSLGLEFAKFTGVVERYWPELQALIGIQQEADWHPEGDVWVHTLQVVDAMTAVTQERNINDETQLVLMLAALCHDLGKPSTTKFHEGKWRAWGHEPAGVTPTAEFLKRFNFHEHIKKMVLALVPDHMTPHEIHNIGKRLEQEGKNNHSAIRRLASRLSQGNATIEMLAYVAEADQRGRRKMELEPLIREELPKLEIWQPWLLNKAEMLQVKQSAPTKIVDGNSLLHHLSLDQKKEGAIIGVIMRCLYEDQLDGSITSIEEGLAASTIYHTWLSNILQSSANRREVIDQLLKSQDIRKAIVEK